ncbi:MAG: MBL fold metallo-hydrolase, partial [Sphaerochaetaceae bacterium]|nr:MBL fold metallo-hydrolase [Sphaerochaetaceae bacterium]
LTDCSGIPDDSWRLLDGLEVLVIGALRRKPHPTHFSVGQAVEAAQRIGAKQTYLTHLCHESRHQELDESLPGSIHVAYDTLRLHVSG